MKVRVERKIGAATSFHRDRRTGQASRRQLSGPIRRNRGVGGRGHRPAAARRGDFFPLTCDYRERVAAAGKFPGGFLKREGRPTTKETLTARLMDRPIRPLFPEWFHDEVQIQSFVLASDRQNDGDVLAMNGASAALGLSPLPFQGPLGSVRLGYINGEFVPFPTHDELEESDLDLIVSGSKDAILMIEGFAREMPESLMAEAIAKAHELHPRDLRNADRAGPRSAAVKKQYEVRTPEPDPFIEAIAAKYFEDLKQAKRTEGKQARAEAVRRLKERVHGRNDSRPPRPKDAVTDEKFAAAWHTLEAAGGPRSDPFGHPARRPRHTRPCGRSAARSTCCRASTARPCSSAARRRPWSRSRWAPAATSSAWTG